MSTVPNFLDFTINAVLHPTFIRKLCYKLSSILTFTVIQIFLSKLCLLYWMASELPRRDERQNWRKVDKKQTYMKTETCKLYSRDFWIFLPNIIKIDSYNFKLYRFKVGAFLRHRVVAECVHIGRPRGFDMWSAENDELVRFAVSTLKLRQYGAIQICLLLFFCTFGSIDPEG